MNKSRLALFAVLAGLLAAASIPAAASAATQRYASPAGTGTDCSAAIPCSIEDAVDAKTGDEVIVNPGDYPLTETLIAPKGITIHGVAGRPRPRLLFSGPGQRGVRLDLDGTTLRYVEIVQAGEDSALFANLGASVDQVIAKASGNFGAPTANIRDSAISNSILVSTGTNGTALATENGLGTAITSGARNVTAIATGSGGIPIRVMATTTASATLHLVNVIAYAGPGAISLSAQTDGSGAEATITASYTNYQSVDLAASNAKLLLGGGNRAEEPAFVNPAAGDYRQAPGSYTIDAGIDYPGFDVDGDPRAIGTTDIGADEFVPAQPAPTPPPPSPLPAPVPQPRPTPPFAGVELVSSRLTHARGEITVRLRCPAGTVGRCAGRTKLTARARRTSARGITLGRAGFSIAPGDRVRARVRVTRAGRRLLNRTPRLRGRAVNVARDAAGRSKTIRAAVTIRRRHG